MAVVSTVASRGLVASQPVVSAIRFQAIPHGVRVHVQHTGSDFKRSSGFKERGNRKHGRVVLTLAKQIGIDAVNQFMPCILIAEQCTFR